MTDQTITTTPTTIQEAAGQLSRALVNDKRDDGSLFYKLTDDSPEWMTEVIRAAHCDEMPNDTVYEFVNRIAGHLADCEEGEEEDAIGEIEADVYTSDLTGWLHASVNYVAY